MDRCQSIISPTTVRPRLLGVDEHTSLGKAKEYAGPTLPGGSPACPVPRTYRKSGAGAIGERPTLLISTVTRTREIDGLSRVQGSVAGRVSGEASTLHCESSPSHETAEYGDPSGRGRRAYRRITRRSARHETCRFKTNQIGRAGGHTVPGSGLGGGLFGIISGPIAMIAFMFMEYYLHGTVFLGLELLGAPIFGIVFGSSGGSMPGCDLGLRGDVRLANLRSAG